MTWLIKSDEGAPGERYFSRKVARNLGSSLGWTEKREDATPFETEHAAHNFGALQMNHMRYMVVEMKE